MGDIPAQQHNAAPAEAQAVLSEKHARLNEERLTAYRKDEIARIAQINFVGAYLDRQARLGRKAISNNDAA